MTNIFHVLSKEKRNRRNIYLYASGEQWFAYEHSAYHFMQLFQMGDIKLIDGLIRLVIDADLEFINSHAMNSVDIISVDDRMVKIVCSSTFEGYDQWKATL